MAELMKRERQKIREFKSLNFRVSRQQFKIEFSGRKINLLVSLLLGREFKLDLVQCRGIFQGAFDDLGQHPGQGEIFDQSPKALVDLIPETKVHIPEIDTYLYRKVTNLDFIIRTSDPGSVPHTPCG